MNDTQTLDPFSSKPKERIFNTLNEIGGSMELPDMGEGVIEETKEAGLSLFDLVKEDILGLEQKPKSPMPATGSLEFQNVAKTPELLEKEKEARNKKIFYSSLKESAQAAQNFAHEKILDEIVRMEVAGMSTEEKNKEAHYNLDYDEKHHNNPYVMNVLRAKKKEQIEATIKTKDQQTAAEVAPKGPEFDKNKANELGPTSIYNAAG